LDVIGDISHNGNLVSNNIFIKENLEVVKDTSINDLYIYGNVETSTQFNQLMTIGNDSIFGNVILDVIGDISHNGNLVSNNIFIKENLEVVNDTSINDLYIYGNVETSTQFNQLMTIGNDSIFGNVILDITGDIRHSGNLVSNNIFIKENLEVVNDTSINDLYIYGNVETSTQFNQLMTIGNDSTVGNIINIHGDINHNGSLFSKNTVFEGTLKCNDNTTIDKDLIVNGNISLNNGSINVQYDSNDFTISPFILYNLRDLSQNIQDVLDDISLNLDVRLNTNNHFIGDNTFTGNLTANAFNIIKEVNVIGDIKTFFNNYVGENKVGYFKAATFGSIKTSHNLICTGETVTEYIYNANEQNILSEGGYYNANAFFRLGEVPLGATTVKRVEGGRVECLDISMARLFNMYGNTIIHGTLDIPQTGHFIVNEEKFSSAELLSALKATLPNESGNTEYNTSTLFGNLVTFDANVIVNEELNIVRNIKLADNTLITQDILGNISGITEHVQFKLNDLTNSITTLQTEVQSSNQPTSVFENSVTFNGNVTVSEELNILKNIKLADSTLITQDILGNIAGITENVQTKLDELSSQISSSSFDTTGNIVIDGTLNVINDVCFNNTLQVDGNLLCGKDIALSEMNKIVWNANNGTGRIWCDNDPIHTDMNFDLYSSESGDKINTHFHFCRDPITGTNNKMINDHSTGTQGAIVFRIRRDGRVDCGGDIYATSFKSTSDYRMKENIEPIDDNYTVDNLRPVYYILKHSKEPHIGFIAHELQEHFPTAVNGEKDSENMQTVNYSELIPVLVKEIQDLKREVSSLKSEISILKT
jgi:cytoskeletal protein CcmA (bactofilin family)